MRYKITLSYDGTSFSGWQIQPNAPSVQATLQQALTVLLGEEIAVTGAGRTDAGVHAVRYVAHFDSATNRLGAQEIGYKLNAILPPSIVVHEVVPAADDFHARFDAVSRTYLYFINRGKDPFTEHYSWRCGWSLDVDAMNAAAAHLLGTHDFSCFEKTGGNNKTSICTVTEAFWAPYTPQSAGILGMPGSMGGSDVAGGVVRGESVGRAVSGVGADAVRGSSATVAMGGDGGAVREAGLAGASGAAGGVVPGMMCVNGGAVSSAPGARYLVFRISADRFLRNMVRAIVGTLVEVGRGKRTPDSIPALLASHDRCSAGESVPANALFLISVLYQ